MGACGKPSVLESGGRRARRVFLRCAAVASLVAFSGTLRAPVPALASTSPWGPVTRIPGFNPTITHSASCASPSFCVAVDGHGEAVTWDGRMWSATSQADPDALTSVSCTSPSFCMAVGIDGAAVTDEGAKWSAPVQIDEKGTVLAAISCTSPGFCMAVDEKGRSFSFNGTRWSGPVQIDPVWGMISLSCTSPGFCMAVDEKGRAFSFIGTRWSGPVQIDQTGQLNLQTVSCASARFCLAGDGQGNALTYDGKSWAAPIAVDTNGFGALSCTSSSFCMGVDNLGSYVTFWRPPAVTAISPSIGPSSGGPAIVISGSGFGAATAVYFGSAAATSFTVNSDTEITAVAPAHAVGPVDVTVATPPGTSAITSADTFTYATLATPTGYHPVDPARICDTRAGGPKSGCGRSTSLGPAGTLTIDVAGNGGVPETGTTAVVANVTVTNTTAGGYLTVYPAGQSPPVASNLNWSAHETVANLVTVGLSSQGAITVYNAHGTADVIVDVEGYFASAPAGEGLYDPLSNPARICDTRANNPSKLAGTALSQCEGAAPATPGTLTVAVAGLGGLPQSGVAAAVLNVTAVAPTTGGYLTVYPASTTRPLASNVNYRPGDAVPNRVVVRLGTQGKVAIFASSGDPQILVDVTGYYGDGSNPSDTGSTFTPALSPLRICDTRTTVPYTTPCTGSTLAPNSTLDVAIAGTDGIPAGVSAVIANVTVTGTTIPSYLTVYPSGQSRPTISDLNWQPQETTMNLVIGGVGSGGKITVYNARGVAGVIVDVVGWYA